VPYVTDAHVLRRSGCNNAMQDNVACVGPTKFEFDVPKKHSHENGSQIFQARVPMFFMVPGHYCVAVRIALSSKTKDQVRRAPAVYGTFLHSGVIVVVFVLMHCCRRHTCAMTLQKLMLCENDGLHGVPSCRAVAR